MKRITKKILSYCYLFALSIVILFPIFVTFSSAFQTTNTKSFYLKPIKNPTLLNFKNLFTNTKFGLWYKNTLIVASLTTIVQLIFVTLTGYVFSKFNFKGKRYGLMFFILIQMIPTTSALTAYYVMGSLLRSLDQYWFLTLVYIGGAIPMNSWLMKGYFDTIPKSLQESARLDGASEVTIFRKIMLPLVKPMLAVQSLWAFMTPFGDYMLANFLLRNPNKLTVAVGLQSFISDVRNQNIALFSAGSMLVAIPIMVMFFALQRNFINDLVSGSTKG